MRPPALSSLAEDEEVQRLLRYLTLSKRFLFGLVHTQFPLAADALCDALPPLLAALREEPVRLVRRDPHADRADPNAPLTQEDMVERVLWPLREGPAEDRARGVVQIIDGSHFLPSDTLAWSYLFARMNEQRNGIVQRLDCELLLLGPTEFLDLFIDRAPDFWSIRSGEFCEEMAANQPPPLSLDELRQGWIKVAARPDNELLLSFFQLAPPHPGEFLLTALLREAWSRAGEAFAQAEQGQFTQARQPLSEATALLEHRLDEATPVVLGSPSFFFLWFQVSWLGAFLAYQAGHLRAAQQILLRAEERSRAIPSPQGGCLQELMRGALLSTLAVLQRWLGDAARAEANAALAASLLRVSQETVRATTTRKQINTLLEDRGHQNAIDPSEVDFTLLNEPYQPQIAACRAALQGSTGQTQINLLWRLGNLALWAGDLDLSWTTAQEMQQKANDLPSERDEALAWGLLGDIHEARGELKEALKIREEKELPVYQRLGDVRSEALTWGKIGDIYRVQGKLEEALKIRQEKQLPVYQRLGDVREEALAWGKIGDIYQVQGKLEEALKIREEKELPVYQRLGDVHSEALTWSQIGDIYRVQGKLEEALKIREEKELPVYQRLGDVHSEALAWGKIGDIYQVQGKLEEALKIREEKELTVLQRLGDRRGVLVAQTNLALIYLKRAQVGDREQARDLLQEALQSAEDLRLPEAEQIRETLRRAGL
jgi:tetratricopeptide (TPR) repeat protein